MLDKKELFAQTVEHIDITRHNCVPMVEAMRHMAFSARDLARAADVYDRMLRDSPCGVILCLAGSLVSAGLKKVFVDMIRNRLVDDGHRVIANAREVDTLRDMTLRPWEGRRVKIGNDGTTNAVADS